LNVSSIEKVSFTAAYGFVLLSFLDLMRFACMKKKFWLHIGYS
jgi:hypothetical protein